MWALGRRAGRLHTPGPEQRSQQRRGVGQRLATVTGRAVAAGGRPSPHVRTANDGPLQERRQSEHSRLTVHSSLCTVQLKFVTGLIRHRQILKLKLCKDG